MKRRRKHHIPATPGKARLPVVIRPQGGDTQPFQPTQKMREAVESMAGYGMTQADIAHLITEDGISLPTLRQYFRKELDRGAPKANASVSQRLYQRCMAGDITAIMTRSCSRPGRKQASRAAWRARPCVFPEPGAPHSPPRAKRAYGLLIEEQR